MTSPTPNKGYTYPAHGGATNAWDTPLNTNFDQIDLNLAGYYPITISSTIAAATFNSSYATVPSTAATVTPPSSIAQNLTYVLNGTLTNNQKLVLPSAGGFYNIYNNTAGSFNYTVGGAGGTAATVSQGGTNIVTCYDGTNYILANSNPVAAKLYTYIGNPNGSVAGTKGASNGALTDVIWDATNRQLYSVTTTSSLAAATVWSPQLSMPQPGGYLTPSNNTTTPVNVADATATTLYYTPLVSNWTVLSTGSILFPYQFSQMSLALTASQAANNIYDIFMWYNGGSPVIGTGPSWSAGGGSVTAGSCARGTGAGSTALTRLQGVLVNSVQVSILNGASTYVCPANEAIYLGSIYIDSAAGNVTCHTSGGQSRKWGVWNYYNRRKIKLLCYDSTASWTYNSVNIRASNNDSNNKITTFQGIVEEMIETSFAQNIQTSTGGTGRPSINVSWNTTTNYYGFVAYDWTGGSGGQVSAVTAEYSLIANIGINNAQAVEVGALSGGTFYGTGNNMMFTATWWA